ncbi:MAG: hypothetical protein WDN04_00560 [Rhodospirillales bacterium]
MLRAVSGLTPPVVIAVTVEDEALAQDAVWLDLENPTEEERAQVERATGSRLPTQAEVSEVEASSRLIQDGELLTLSTPMVSRHGTDAPVVAPLGFVVSPQAPGHPALRPQRHIRQFRRPLAPNRRLRRPPPVPRPARSMVDRMADSLEHEGALLEKLTGEVFSPAMAAETPRGRDSFLRSMLSDVGRGGETHQPPARRPARRPAHRPLRARGRRHLDPGTRGQNA